MKVEGVHYEINWAKFRYGTSIFIPCLDPKRAREEEIEPVLRRLRMNVVMKVTIEEGVRGLRIWRV